MTSKCRFVLALAIAFVTSCGTNAPRSQFHGAPPAKSQGTALAQFQRVPLAGKRFVLFGESQHAVRENHEFVARAFRYLVEEQGFRVLVLESSWRIEDVFARYEAGDDAVLSSAEMSIAANAFNSTSLREIFALAREHNRKNAGDRVRIMGMQPESPVSDLEEIRAFLENGNPHQAYSALADVRAACGISETFVTDLDFVMASARTRKEKGSLLSKQGYADCGKAIDLLAKATSQRLVDESLDATTRRRVEFALLGLRNAFLVLHRKVDALALGENPHVAARQIYTEGDSNRFEVFEQLRSEVFPREKVLLWLHSWHVARASAVIDTQGPGVPAKGAVSFGTLMDERHPDESLFLGAVSFDAKTTYPAGNYLEPQLESLLPPGATLIDTQTPWARKTFGQFHRLTAGSDGSRASNMVMHEQFDYVLFFDTLTRGP